MPSASQNDKTKRALAIAKKHMDETTDAEDAKVTRAAKSDPDNPPLDDEFFKRAKRGRPRLAEGRGKERITIMFDSDLLEHFKAGGKGWQTRMNDELRDRTFGRKRRTKPVEVKKRA